MQRMLFYTHTHTHTLVLQKEFHFLILLPEFGCSIKYLSPSGTWVKLGISISALILMPISISWFIRNLGGSRSFDLIREASCKEIIMVRYLNKLWQNPRYSFHLFCCCVVCIKIYKSLTLFFYWELYQRIWQGIQCWSKNVNELFSLWKLPVM